jgi:hypothetical protein
MKPVQSVADYLAGVPPERRSMVSAILEVVRKNLDPAYEEGIRYGMIGWQVPLSVYPSGYHSDGAPLPFAALAAQKNYVSLYLMGLYWGSADSESELTPEARWFEEAWRATGKKLDVGRACVRIKRLEDAALDVIGEAIRRLPASVYVERYEASRPAKKPAAKKPAAKKPAANKPAPKKRGGG